MNEIPAVPKAKKLTVEIEYMDGTTTKFVTVPVNPNEGFIAEFGELPHKPIPFLIDRPLRAIIETPDMAWMCRGRYEVTITMGRSVTHRCPSEGSNITPCCGRSVFVLPKGDRVTEDQDEVTCGRNGVAS